MPTFAILRALPETTTRSDCDAMALESIAMIDLYNRFCRTQGEKPSSREMMTSAFEDGFLAAPAATDQRLDSQVRWIRSYWAPGTTWGMCLYEAPNGGELGEFQLACAVDTGVRTWEVTEVRDPANTNGVGDTTEPPEGWDLVAIDVPIPEKARVAEALTEAAGQAPLSTGEDARWIRAYVAVDDENGSAALALFAVPAPAIDTAMRESGAHRIVEIRPEDYGPHASDPA